MTNLTLHAFDKNQIWLEIAQLAHELLTWTQLLAWHQQPARVGNPSGCGYACSSSPAASSPPDGAASCAYRADGP